MKVLKHEMIVYVDVDSTLVMYPDNPKEFDPQLLPFDFHGITKYNLRPHEKHIDILKSLSVRGHHIVVHSKNGWAWAEHVVRMLLLTAYVDEVRSKPITYIDDAPADEWMLRTYVNETGIYERDEE